MPDNWWQQGNAPNGPLGEKNSTGSLDAGLRDGMGIGFVTIAEGTLYPFMLSSAFTARNYGAASDAEEIEVDILWAFIISVVTGAIIAFFLKSSITLIYAIGLGAGLSLLYMIRGNLLHVPWHIPLVTPKAAG